MRVLLTLPVAVPLLAVALTLLGASRRGLQRAVSLGGTVAVLACAVGLLVVVDGQVVATRIGDFPGLVAIPLAADTFSALFLVTSSVLVLVCTALAWATGLDRHRTFHPLVQALLAGIALALLTADLFNLFVAFETMLISSYALAIVGVSTDERRSAFTYVAVNLFGSTLLLVGIALVYATAGTVNLAALASLTGEADLLLPVTVVLAAFAVKAAVVPVHGWVPYTYVHLHPVVSALFSGLLTKMGVYALYRTVSLLYPDETRVLGVIGLVAGATMVVGVLGAVGRYTMRGILAFHMTSQVGYLLMGLALFSTASLTAGVAYTVQYMVVKAALFLVAATVISSYGTEALSELGGLARRRPGLAVAFGLSAAALAGLPPLSGFVPKLGLILAAFGQRSWLIGAVALVVSLFTLLSMLKIWVGVFWGPGPADLRDATLVTVPAGAADDGAQRGDHGQPRTVVDHRWRASLAAPALVLAGISLALGLGAGPLLDRSGVAAGQLLDPAGYVDAVLGEGVE